MPPINPDLSSRASSPTFDVEALVEGLLNRDRNALSRAITLVESNRPEHREMSEKMLAMCSGRRDDTFRIAITGIPGVGKSTLIESLGKRALQDGHRLAILAVDPSSERSGGSILGDKTRMESLASHENAFVRPSPTRGTLGGVSQTTREAMILCEAAGYDLTIIETVGVGQAETFVHQMVDCFVLLFIAGAGDGLQGIKRGIMEMADILAVNKADGPDREAAASAKQTLQQALDLLPPSQSGWKPTVHLCSALENNGIDELWETITEFTKFVRETRYFERNRQQQRAHWFHALTREALLHDFYQNAEVQELLETLEMSVVEGSTTPVAASKKVISAYLNDKN